MFSITFVAVLAFTVNSVFAAPTTGATHLIARQGYISDCTTTYSVQPGDTCNKIVNQFNDTFTLQDFYAWNPEVDSFCSNLFGGEIVCVGLADTGSNPPPACPVPVAPGLVSDCKSCYKVVEGDSCVGVTSAKGITLADFLAWNPDINAACTNLQLGYNYCVGI